MPDLLATVEFRGAESARPALEALAYLKGADWSSRRRFFPDAPLAVVGKGWRRLAFAGDASATAGGNRCGDGHRKNGRVDRKAYALGALEALHEAMRGREVFVDPRGPSGSVR